MDLMQQYDDYCERTDFTFWSEPLNAITNLSFLIAALILLRLTRDMGAGRGMARTLSWILFVLAFGSFAFHTFATGWAMLADVLPIAAFVLVYAFAIGRDFMGLSVVKALLIVVAFIGFTVLSGPLFAAVPHVGGTAGYLPIPTFLLGLIIWVGTRYPATAGALAVGLGMMVVSLIFRTIDLPLCGAWPHGTHFLWHTINGIMLGWFIQTYRRHMLEGARAAL